MRSIPFRVICLLGMNNGEFPRQEYPDGFDLMARKPRRGDRSKGNDDRFVFLEALLSAGERLLIFYQGNSLTDGKSLPPSLVVDELIDCLADSFVCSPESLVLPAGRRREELLARIVTRHPLQPFSRRYFSGEAARLFSFAGEYCQAARAGAAGRREEAPFFSAPLPITPSLPSPIFLSELIRCLKHPGRFFLENGPGLFLAEKERAELDREPIHFAALENYQLKADLLAGLQEGQSRSSLLARLKGQGRLPLGEAAKSAFAGLDEQVAPLAEALARNDCGPELVPLLHELALGNGLVLHGELGERRPGGRLIGRVSQVHGRVLLGHWLEHLFLAAAAPGDQLIRTILVCAGEKNTAKVLSFSALAREEALTLLAELTDLYLAARQQPFSFFPQSSFAFANAIHRSRNAEKSEAEPIASALARARAEYRGGNFSRGEGEDPYLRQLYGHAPPIPADAGEGEGSEFVALAEKVFLPMLARMEEK